MGAKVSGAASRSVLTSGSAKWSMTVLGLGLGVGFGLGLALSAKWSMTVLGLGLGVDDRPRVRVGGRVRLTVKLGLG